MLLLSPRARGSVSGVCFLGDPLSPPPGHSGERSLSDPGESSRTPVLGGWWRDSWERLRISPQRQKVDSFSCRV